jgi:hypothetical protein
VTAAAATAVEQHEPSTCRARIRVFLTIPDDPQLTTACPDCCLALADALGLGHGPRTFAEINVAWTERHG